MFRAVRTLAVAVLLGLASTLAVGATPAHALDLDQARAQGLIGERADGYAGVVTPSAEANALVADVNARRRAAYADIAAKNGTSPEAVGSVTAERLIARLPKGAFVQDASGRWVRK